MLKQQIQNKSAKGVHKKYKKYILTLHAYLKPTIK